MGSVSRASTRLVVSMPLDDPSVGNQLSSDDTTMIKM
jgi:hypothetical protein